MPNIFSGDGAPSNGGIISVLQNGVRTMGELITTLKTVFPAASGTATTATGGSATLPSNPIGFIVVTLPDGTSAKVPYYG
jgi:hypothetical protein